MCTCWGFQFATVPVVLKGKYWKRPHSLCCRLTWVQPASPPPSYRSDFLTPLLVSSLCVEARYISKCLCKVTGWKGFDLLNDSKKSVDLFQYDLLSMVPGAVKITYFWPKEKLLTWAILYSCCIKNKFFQVFKRQDCLTFWIFWDVLFLPTGQIIAKYVFVIKKICHSKVGQRQAARTPHCFLALNFRGHRHSSPLWICVY